MPRTNTEIDADLATLAHKVADLDKDAAVRQTQTEGLAARIDDSTAVQKETTEKLEEYLRRSDARFAVLEQQMSDMRAERDKWAARFWQLAVTTAAGVLAAVILAVIGLRKP